MILSCTWWSTAGALPISAELLLRVSRVELLLFPFPLKGLANKQLPGLTVFLVDLWIKLDNLSTLPRSCARCGSITHIFLALLMSLSIELM